MKPCPICDYELPVNANFCGKCGFHLRNTTKSTGKTSSLRFWVVMSLIVCLIAGSGAYIVSTYLFYPISSAAHVSSSNRSAEPILSVQGLPSAIVEQGQTVILHGERFRANDPIAFLLDSVVPIKDENNQTLSIRASNMGSFDVSIPIQGSDWSASLHYIQGVDNLTKQDAYVSIMVSSGGVLETESQNLDLSIQGKTVTGLTFHAVAGQKNPAEQRVTLTNSSGSPLHWMATVSADHGLSWLVIDDYHLSGNLDINGTDSIGIRALITSLGAQANPYTGQVVFTINGQEQLVLPVELQVVDLQSEIVFTPNPAVVTLGVGNTCQPTTFTLINLGSAFINWMLVPYDSDTENHIQFIANGQSIRQGELASSGFTGDTQVLNLQCNNVSAGNSYEFTIYVGNTSLPVTITVQP